MKTVSEQLLDTLRAAHERSRQGFSITDELARAVTEAEALLAVPELGTCDGNHGGPRCADPECWNDSPPASDTLKDNQIAALINKVCRLAREFHNHDSLRQRIAQELVPELKAAPEPLTDHVDHIPEIAARLRLVAKLAGCPEAVPEDDLTAVGCIFSVLGNMRRALELKQATPEPVGEPGGVPLAWQSTREGLVAYVLQDDLHNRLTPRVIDIAYSAFMSGQRGQNKDDGGPRDWFNDTKPLVLEAIEQIRSDIEKARPGPNASAAWPKTRDVGRFGDMHPLEHLRVGLDSDNDVYVSVWGEDGGASVEFCNPGGGGGGSSRRTREALIALMVAMEADNAERPDKDWWARRNGASEAKGGQA